MIGREVEAKRVDANFLSINQEVREQRAAAEGSLELEEQRRARVHDLGRLARRE